MNTSEKNIPAESAPAETKKQFLFRAAVFSAVFIWFGFWALFDIDVHHDGLMLATADLISRQMVLFREVFCQYGPLTHWIQSFFVKFFGTEVIVIRLATVLFYALVALLGAQIWGRFLEKPFRSIWYICFFVLCPFYLVCFHPWTSVYALFFMLLGVEFQLRYLETPQPRWQHLLWSGCCAGAAFLCRTPCGIVTFLAGVTVVAGIMALHKGEGKLKIAGAYAGGAGAVLGVFALYLTIAGAWEDYLRQCFIHITGFAFNGGRLHYFRDLFGGIFNQSDPFGLTSFIFLLMIFLTVVVFFLKCSGILTLDREKLKKQLPLLAVVMIVGASFHQFYPVPCVRHLWWASIPAFGIYALCIQGVWKMSVSKELRILLLTLLLLPLLGAFLVRSSSAVKKIQELPRMTISNLPAMQGLIIKQEDEAFFKRLYAAVDSLPEELKNRPVLNHTPDGFYTCVMRQGKIIHPMFVNWPNVYPDYNGYVEYIIDKERPLVFSTGLVGVRDYKLIFSDRFLQCDYKLFAPLY